MAGLTLASMGSAFPHRITRPVIEVLNLTCRMRKLVRPSTLQWKGSYIEGRVHVQLNPAVAWMQDGGNFQTPDHQSHIPYKVFTTNIGGAVQLSDNVLAAGSGGENNAVDVIKSEMETITKTLLKVENGAFPRDGTGILCSIRGSNSNGVDNPTAADVTVYVSDLRLLMTKGVYEVRDPNNNYASRGTITVTKRNNTISTGTYGNYSSITIASPGLPTGVTAGDVMVKQGTYGVALVGLEKLVDNSAVTLQGVDVSLYPEWASPVIASGGNPLDATLFRQLLAAIKQGAEEEAESLDLVWLTNNWQLIEVEELYEEDLRIQPSDSQKGLPVVLKTAFGTVRPETDPDFPFQEHICINPSALFLAQQSELHWRGVGGQNLVPSQQAAVHNGTVWMSEQMYITNRKTCGKITGSSETSKWPY
jgi:hypothetical protein